MAVGKNGNGATSFSVYPDRESRRKSGPIKTFGRELEVRVPERKMRACIVSVVIRCLSKCVKSFLHFKTTLCTQDPQGFHKLVPTPTATSLPSGEPRLASA